MRICINEAEREEERDKANENAKKEQKKVYIHQFFFNKRMLRKDVERKEQDLKTMWGKRHENEEDVLCESVSMFVGCRTSLEI